MEQCLVWSLISKQTEGNRLLNKLAANRVWLQEIQENFAKKGENVYGT